MKAKAFSQTIEKNCGQCLRVPPEKGFSVREMEMRFRAIFVLLFTMSVFAGNGFGQAIGSITGVVQDATGARIPGVTVTATATATGVKSETFTNEAGAYNFSNLSVGPYGLEAALPGFRSARVANIDLRSNETLRFDLTMEVGNLDTQIEVSVDAREVLAVSSASIGQVLSETQVAELPLVGGDVLDLVSVLPGFRVGGGVAGVNTDSFAGISSNSINTVRDGLSVSDGRFQNGVFGTTVLNPDMVQEVRLILTPVDAEFGRGNGQVQITTRSGTNSYNGAAVWSVRNSGLNANTWSNNNDINPATGQWQPTVPDWENHHQLTLSFGGPIKKNKTFFYGLFDRNFVRAREIVNGTVLTDTARQGIYRYFDGWTPDDADATPGATSRPAVDFQGNPLGRDRDPSNYSGRGLICFSVFGNLKVSPSTFQMSPFTQADCPGGTAIFPTDTIGLPYWDAGRQVADTTGLLKNYLGLMPRANRFQGGDGLNTAQIRWTRSQLDQGINSPSAYGGDANIERKQFNIKFDHNFNQRHKASAGLSIERDYEGSNFSNWPDNISGLTRRAPWVLTSSFTSTLSSSLINEARFGIRYNVLNEFDPWEHPDADIASAAEKFFIQGSGGWPAVFNNNPGSTGFTSGLFGTGNANSPINNGDANGNRTPLYSYGDTLSWTKGTHAYKFGGEIRLTKSIGYNGIPVRPIPVLSGGAGANVASNISTTTGGLPGLVTTAATNQVSAQNMSRYLLYFLNGSINSGSQLYWIDDANDVKNGKWEDYKTLGRKYRDQVQNEFSFFAKDDWKISKSLTLNLGLRWEYYAVPYIGSGFTTTTPGQGLGLFGPGRSVLGTDNPFNKWLLTPGNLYLSGYGPRGLLECKMGQASGIAGIPASTCDSNLLTGVEFVGPNSPNPDKGVYRKDRNNFGPAIGFAWQLPFAWAGQTTMRGGYQLTYGGSGRNGISSDGFLGGAPGATSNASIDFAALGNPYLNLDNVASLVPLKPTNPVLPGGTLAGPYGRTGSFTAFDPNYTTPYVQNFTLLLTHQLHRNMTVDLRYVGTQGKKRLGDFNLNLPNVFYNPELFNALETVRAGGEAPIFDQLFAGLNLNSGTAGYGTIGTMVNGVVQTGSLHLRRRYATDLAEGDYITIANFINSNTGGNPTAGLLPFNSTLTNVGGRILRNGCDRLANGQATVGPSISTPLRCFPEDYLVANPQLGNGTTGPTYNANLGSSNYHSMEAQFTLRPTLGTNLQATYTWSKSLELPWEDWTDPLNRDADYRLASNHRAHEFRMNGAFELPIGPGRLLFRNSSGLIARAIEGWRMSWTYNLFSGPPESIEAQDMLYDNGTPDVVGPWNLTGGDIQWGQNVGAQNLGGTYFGKVGTYQVVTDPQCAPGGILDSTDALGFNIRTGITCPLMAIADSSGRIVLQNPRPGKRGTLGQRTVTGPGDWTLDGSLSKSFKITESKTLQVRFDAINVLNHPRLTGNNVNPEYSINDADFGTMNTKGNQTRNFQAQLRLQF
jgi:hypothetical protein